MESLCHALFAILSQLYDDSGCTYSHFSKKFPQGGPILNLIAKYLTTKSISHYLRITSPVNCRHLRIIVIFASTTSFTHNQCHLCHQRQVRIISVIYESSIPSSVL